MQDKNSLRKGRGGLAVRTKGFEDPRAGFSGEGLLALEFKVDNN